MERADGSALSPEELPVSRALRGESVRSFEMRLRRADEPARRPTWVSVSAGPVLDRRGMPLGAVATYTDVSRLHALHEEREDLFRMVTHDLRAPLAAMMAKAQILMRRARSFEDVRRSAESIRTSGEKMELMVRELSEAVRLEAGKVQFEPRPVEIAGSVHGLLDRLGGSIPVERVRVEGREAFALADPAALERVFLNLITNALKYSPEHEPVSVSLEPGGDVVVVRVKDNGPGIEPEDQSRIFERFYRRSQDAQAEGLGLGLYITRLLVERMGGHIEVQSSPGEGTVFVVTLPSAPEPVRELAEAL